MRTRYANHHRNLSELKWANSVQQCNASDLVETSADLVLDDSQLWYHLGLVGLVFEHRHAGSVIGVVSNCAAENNDSATRWEHTPVVDRPNRQPRLGQGEPGITR